MTWIIQAVVAALIAAPAATQEVPGPQCRATLEEDRLLTTIHFGDGTGVEGPWRVVESRSTALGDGVRGLHVEARLDRIVEIDAEGRRTPTPFPDPIHTTFEAPDEDRLVEQAAQVWCLTVLKVQSVPGQPFGGTPPPRPQRTTHIAR